MEIPIISHSIQHFFRFVQHEVVILQEFTIRLHSFQDVQRLFQLLDQLSFRATLSDGQQSVDVGSMMRVFSLNLQHDLRLCVACGEEDIPTLHTTLSWLEVK